MIDSLANQTFCWPYAILWILILAVLGTLFVSWLNRLIKKNRNGLLWVLFGAILILGTAIYYYCLGISDETSLPGNQLQVLFVALLSALELFIGQAHLYDGIISEVIFSKPGLLCMYSTTYLFAVLFTGVLLFKFITKRWDSRLWLRGHSKKANEPSSDRENHVFFGINRYSILLGKDILSKRKNVGYLLYVDAPGDDEDLRDLSITDLISNLFSRNDDRLDEALKKENVIVLKARKHIKDAFESDDPMKFIALSKLQTWLDNPKNKVYILSENEQDNLQSLQSLSKVKAEVFCHARKEGINQQLERYFSVSSGQTATRIHLVDSSFLAVETLKRRENLELQPVRFVDIARDGNGRKQGYVTSPFNAMILGFGETGQEMLKFLYEFGAFVGAGKKQSASSFRVFDSDLERLKGAFLSHCPALAHSDRIKWEELQFNTQGTVETEGIRVDSAEFWDEYDKSLDSMNYVVVALGDERTNVEIGIRLMEYSLQRGKALDKFVILVRLNNRDSQYARMLEFYDKYYCDGGKKLVSFGEDELIWQYDVLTRASIQEKAERYFGAYQDACGEKVIKTWKDRRDDVLGIRGRRIVTDPATGLETPDSESVEKYGKYLAKHANKLANQMELTRKEGQDYANCFHAATKLELCDSDLYQITGYADRIPASLDDRHTKHYPDSDYPFDVLENLAIGEHIRWVASHEASGIIKGERNELLKKNQYLIPYAEIEDTPWDWGNGIKVEQIRHYDWIVVKTTLLLENQKRLDD